MVNSTLTDQIKIPILSGNVFYLFSLTAMIFGFCVFMYLAAVMLAAHFTSPSMKREARYILFAHMLINDIMYLILSYILHLESVCAWYLPAPVCYILVTVSSTSFKVTPYNLGVMSVERYIAIYFPLRHAEFCTQLKSMLAIVAIWVVALIPNVIDFIILCLSVKKDFFYLYFMCSRSAFIISGVQETLRSATHAFTFSAVGLAIVVTYIKIFLIARKVNAGKASANKAQKTVMLHAFQLLLCMLAFSYNLTESLLRNIFPMMSVLNFFVFMCLPRIISPLIYGIRDEGFSKYIRRFVICKPGKIGQPKI